MKEGVNSLELLESRTVTQPWLALIEYAMNEGERLYSHNPSPAFWNQSTCARFDYGREGKDYPKTEQKLNKSKRDRNDLLESINHEL